MSEEMLYKPIEDMFIKKGYLSISSRKKLPNERVHSAFGVNVNGVNKKTDVVSFRLMGDDIDAKAVEVKQGNTWEAAGQALGQATAYQRMFPEVYVATQANEDGLKHVESLLRELGLGYISVENNKAEEIFPPAHNIRFNQKEFERQVKEKVVVLLACYSILGSNNFQFGRADRPGYVWISSLEQCNITCSIDSIQNPGTVWFGVNIERKRAIRNVFSSVTAEDIYKLLVRLPPHYVIRLQEFASYRPKKYAQKEEKPFAELTLHDIDIYLRKIREWDWKAHIIIRKPVQLDVVSKTSVSSELEKSIEELLPLQKLFNQAAALN